MNKSITMNWSKSTKGTQVYACNDADIPVSTIYIKRSSLPDKPPTKITVTIDFGNETE